MLNAFLNFQKYFDDKYIKILNKKLKGTIKVYAFVVVTNEISINNNVDIFQNIRDSKVIIINSHEENDIQYFIIGFKKTILIVEKLKLHYLQDLLLYNKSISVCFWCKEKTAFHDQINYKFDEIMLHHNFQIEYDNFSQKFIISLKISEKWRIVQPCIIVYLILQGYLKLTKNRLNEFPSNLEKIRLTPKIIDESDYIHLRNIGNSYNSNVDLIYHIEKEELFAIKKYLINKETEKLSNRELFNYPKIFYPFLPKLIGKTNSNNIIIEYINGQLLNNIDKINLKFDEKLTIIFELMLTIEYLHRNHFIYRDLKPNNIMIDQNKTVILIDFDRMIELDSIEKDQINTKDFSSLFSAPEIQSSTFSYENDIYSLGMMIYFIMNEKISERAINSIKINDKNLNRMWIECTNLEMKKRPLISNLIVEFFAYFYKNIQIENIFEKFENYFLKKYDFKLIKYLKNIGNIETDPKLQNFLGDLFIKGQYFSPNIQKGLYYYQKSVKNNYSWAQVNLGLIFVNGKYCKQDINEAINLFKLAGDQKNCVALFHLGEIYLNILNPKDVKNAIKYYEKAADLNHLRSQKKLGLLYLENKYGMFDINKAIKYLSLAAYKNNDVESQYKLGLIYYEDKYIKRNIDLSIDFFELAAKQNDKNAQFQLGLIYYENKYVNREINKSIFYFKCAAEHNFAEAEKCLGDIYYIGKYYPKDIKKGIRYYQLAAEHGSIDAQVFIGLNCMIGILFEADYEKAARYLQTAYKQNHPLVKSFLELKKSNDKKQAFNNYIFQLTNFLANHGDISCQYILAWMYFSGKEVKRDIQKALFYFSESADQNYIPSIVMLGGLYLDGEYLPKDVNKAINYFNIAAKQNDPEAQYRLGMIYLFGNYVPRDVKKAIYLFELADAQDFAIAQYNLGVIYLSGIYIEKNYEKAFNYFKKSANNNFISANIHLGYMYENGIYVEQNINIAIKYYEIASSFNDSIAQINLGFLYFDGIKTEKDVKKAFEYFRKASNQNIPQAFCMLGILHYIYINDFDNKKSLSYFLNALKYGKENIVNNILFAYYDNFNIKRYILAKNYSNTFTIQDSINQSNFSIGFIYFEGKCVKRDIQKSIDFYKNASSFNISKAKNNLGIIYKHNLGNDESEKQLCYAEEYFTEAINQKNDLMAMYNLAHLYIYDYNSNEKIDDSIKLLIQIIEIDQLKIAKELLSIALIKKIGGINRNMIKNEIIKYTNKSYKLFNEINNVIKSLKLYKQNNFKKEYENYRGNTYVYNPLFTIICTKRVLDQNENQSNDDENQKQNITQDFYDGFGIDLH